MTREARLRPPYRAEHIGSLLRPSELKTAFRAFADGLISADEFRDVQDRAISEVVALQEDVGLEVVTDGEFRRASYWGRFVERVDGLTVREALFQFRDDAGHTADFTAPHVDGRVRRTTPITVDEYAYLSSVTTRTPKITMPSPPTMHFFRGREGIDPGVYGDAAEFFSDLGRVYREEIADLASHGARYVQLDEVPLAMLCDGGVRDRVRARGDDPEALVSLYVDSFRHALADRPPQVTVGMHLCRGNFKGKYLAEGAYEAVAERMFSEIPVDAFFLEYETPRAGDFGPLRFVPDDKVVVLGLVSSKTPELESLESLERRVDDASRHVSLDQLAISPQCGFASTVGGNPVTVDDQMAKLCLVVEAAQRIWR